MADTLSQQIIDYINAHPGTAVDAAMRDKLGTGDAASVSSIVTSLWQREILLRDTVPASDEKGPRQRNVYTINPKYLQDPDNHYFTWTAADKRRKAQKQAALKAAKAAQAANKKTAAKPADKKTAAKPADNVVPLVQPVVQPEPEPAEVLTLPEPQPAHAAPLTLLVDRLADEIAQQLIGRLHVKITGHVANLIDQLRDDAEAATMPTASQLAERIANAVQPTKSRKPVVLIIGLLPAQAGMISDEFGDCFELRFWKDEHHDLLKGLVRGSDVVLLVTSKMSHMALDLVKSMNGKIMYSNGGMSQLRENLTKLYCKLTDRKSKNRVA